MNLYEKLLTIQKSVDKMIKDGKNTSDKYDFASDENVLDIFRPLMDANALLLIPQIMSASVTEGTTRSGSTRFFTEVYFKMTWHDCESGEELSVPWYAQGVDLAGEKGVGKAATYAEKYFLLKFFHVPTKKDDPDADKRSTTERTAPVVTPQNAEYYRTAIEQMLTEVSGGDTAKFEMALLSMTESKKYGYAGVKTIAEITDAALQTTYGKTKRAYEKKMGKPFELKKEEDA